MKTIVYLTTTMMAVVIMSSCTAKQVDTDTYLREMRERLDQIQSASYMIESWDYLPGNPEPRQHMSIYYKELKNPADTTVGTIYLYFSEDDSTLLNGAYDGEAKYAVYHEHRGIVRDDFTARDLPFRVVSNPFFRCAYHIIDYALTTHDSIEYSLTDSVDYYKFYLITHEEEQIEFIGGKAQHIYSSRPLIADPTSEYEIWFSKQSGLPYRIKRIQDHDINDHICHNLILNAENPADFDLNDYLPQGYTIRPYKVRERSAVDANSMLNHPAPIWSLSDLEGKTISLKDLHSQVILLEFSATACGPCQAAIPFLKQLRQEYTDDELQIISFESWGASDSTIKFYAEKKELTYPYIRASEDMLNSYKTGGSAPWFFLLDSSHFVRKVFFGYGEGTTDQEIRDAIMELINKS
ncbi:MAG: TlpA family protein disulfide reductase [Bacteroidaceae bacterium]|nr:TlpA family protein disulfide reductase [Bacteroidaceae bacterium]